ncbi:hypothetical protein PVAP13_6NG313001 [Panicum virgatum]|uniref:Secreted protein n=1 Tax=Panicum virgatum TaxID=38727 RepID=A0A8T0R3C1_PANVG|nr:hypothetical protein PVAP13_6NG313001 [Panicum virgatum]
MMVTRNVVCLVLIMFGSWSYEHFIFPYKNAIYVCCVDIHRWFSRWCCYEACASTLSVKASERSCCVATTLTFYFYCLHL